MKSVFQSAPKLNTTQQIWNHLAHLWPENVAPHFITPRPLAVSCTMVSFLPHILIPTLVALAFFRRMPRTAVMAWAFVNWVPDLDFLSPGAHRELSHNVWIPLSFFVTLYLLWRGRGRTMDFWSFCQQPGWPLVLFLWGFYWGAHVLLDVFAGGVVLFWPVSDYNFQLYYEIIIDLQTGEVSPVGDASAEPGGAPEVSTEYPWLYYDHTAVLALLAAIGLVAAVAASVRRWRAASGPADRDESARK